MGELAAQYLTFVNGSCVEVLAKRKHRSDNTSGFRGVTKSKNGRYRASIGLQGKRYNLGSFGLFDQAVAARVEAENVLHGGFLDAWQSYQAKSESDPAWAQDNPFFFNVEKTDDGFLIDTISVE